MTNEFDATNDQELNKHLDTLKTLMMRFQRLPQEIKVMSQEANQETGEALQKLWEGGLSDNVKKMISYTKQAIDLHREFQSVSHLLSSLQSDSSAFSELSEDAIGDISTNKSFEQEMQNIAPLPHVEAVVSPSLPQKKKTKRFV